MKKKRKESKIAKTIITLLISLGIIIGIGYLWLALTK